MDLGFNSHDDEDWILELDLQDLVQSHNNEEMKQNNQNNMTGSNNANRYFYF